MRSGRPELRARACALLISAFLTCSYAAPVAAQSATPAEAPSPATAQSDEPAGYVATVDEAVREFAAKNYEEARALFARAHALYPNARTERGLGLAQFELRNYGESIRHFEAALLSIEKPLTPELRADTQQMLARANNFVARVHLDLKPREAHVLLDGVRVEVPRDEALLLQVGDHTIELQAAGFTTEKRRLSVQSGQEQTLTIILAPKAAPTSATATGNPWYKNPWLWTGVGVVVAGAAAGGAGYALTRGEKQPRAYGGTTGALLDGP